ncbi:type IX secretion system protein PorQ [Labilibaculum sp.]|uniref:type IX secretion system protein PorQ n=1 Tax=Labilibaculum sp. TaxID=2060723 RepID=UPI003563F2C0
MKRPTTLLSLLLLISLFGKAQSGGENIYEFLNLGSSARVAALGGTQIALSDPDADYSFYNPAALHADMDQNVSLNYVNYITDINYGYASYTKNYKDIGTFSIAMHYVNYGKFTEANEFGEITGSFKASDYALIISYARELSKRFRIGISLKPIYSSLEKYTSIGLATDLAFIYDHPNQGFRASIVARNFGYQIKTYYDSHREDLPNEILVGLSTKLQHAPFRFAITYRHLEEFNLNYDSELDSEDESYEQSEEDSFSNKAVKHLILGSEFLPSKNFTVRFGYNFQRNAELKIDEKVSTVGFTWGFGLKVSHFRINYASARYHLAGASNHFSISTRLSDFK